MSRKKPRQPRWPARTDVIDLAKMNASCLTATEVAYVLKPVQQAFDAARTGQLCSNGWSNLAMALHVAEAIERHGVVRGLQADLAQADKALQAIARRCDKAGRWTPTPLYAHELEALRHLVNDHHFQIKQLSAAEYHRAVRAAICTVTERVATGQTEEVT